MKRNVTTEISAKQLNPPTRAFQIPRNRYWLVILRTVARLSPHVAQKKIRYSKFEIKISDSYNIKKEPVFL